VLVAKGWTAGTARIIAPPSVHNMSFATVASREIIMVDKNLDTLFHDTLKDIYFAEKAITKALPKMAKAAQATELKDAFTTHLEQTKGHVQRLEQVCELMGKKPQAKTCDAIKGIIAEGDEISEQYADSEALDAGLLAAAQAVEHYEISRYGTLRTWAEELGMDQAAELFEATLNEEKTTDQLLTKLAETSVNLAAEARAG
jgi:ferritin-like metal-binding protein YciE